MGTVYHDTLPCQTQAFQPTFRDLDSCWVGRRTAKTIPYNHSPPPHLFPLHRSRKPCRQ
jgi:hypothetical protein